MSETPAPPPPPPASSPSPLGFLQFEPAPPFGGGTMPVDSEKTMVMLAHFFSIIIWPWKRKESPAVDAHGKEALNFGITMLLIFFIPVNILARVLPLGLWWIFSILSALVSLACLALVIIAMINAKEGKLLRYPINLRLIK
jgi:uncharacterized Tic20 family protein